MFIEGRETVSRDSFSIAYRNNVKNDFFSFNIDAYTDTTASQHNTTHAEQVKKRKGTDGKVKSKNKRFETFEQK